MASYIFKYSGAGITFSLIGGNIFVNATEMARIFNDDTSKWLASKESSNLINDTANLLLRALKYSTVIQPVQKISGFTIIHSALAVAFANTLDPAFGDWVQQCVNNISIGRFYEPGKLTKTSTMENKTFLYNGNSITFQLGNGDVMVNATQMAKNFGKRPVDWMQNTGTQAYLDELCKVRKSTLAELVQVTKGGSTGGTWMHEDVALEFARWLSPSFAIWCNDRIKELLKHGFTATPQKLDELIANPDLVIGLATKLKEERQRNEQLTLENAKLKPRAEFVDKVFDANGLITISQAAKILKLPYGRNILFKKLREEGIFFKNSNEPKQELVKKGYFEIKEHIKDLGEGKNPRVIMQTFSTQKGLAYLAKTLGVVHVPDTKTPIVC